MRTLRAGSLLGSLLMVGACGSRAESPPVEGADSTATVLTPDSVHSDSNRIIGHDSAFGPLFSVDSTGKLVDLPRRTP
jgi:hypothetical protein